MNIFLGGNPLTQKNDTTTIFTQHQYIPQQQPYENPPKIAKSKTSEFIENLYFVTMEVNGFAYFYPNLSRNTNLCRFEWHQNFRDNEYELRVGVTFEVKNSVIYNFCYYISPHSHYEDLQKEYEPYSISTEEVELILNQIDLYLSQAANRIKESPKTTYNILYYVELSKPTYDFLSLNDAVTIFPSKMLNGRILSAIIIKEKGFSYLDSKRKTDEQLNLITALMSVNFVKFKHTIIQNFPVFIDPIDLKFDFTKLNIDKFYPGSDSVPESKSNYLCQEHILYIQDFISLLSRMPSSRSQTRLKNIIFSFASAQDTEFMNKTSSLVSYVACLDSIASKLFPETKNNNGSRKAVLELLSALKCTKCPCTDLDSWTKRIYNDHRSSYVHGSSIKFQNINGTNFTGVPKSIPTNSKPVSKQYEYDNDYNILKSVTRLALIHYTQIISGVILNIPNINNDICFSGASVPEAYIGMVNNGYMRILGQISST